MNASLRNQPTPHAQRGIGLAGFIVGIVVGLAVALAVAVYITKVPTPFTDKSGVKTAEQQAADEARQKSWDPNAPLAGKGSSGTVQPVPGTPPVVTVPNNLPPGTLPAGQTAVPGTDPNTTAGLTDVEREAELARARADAEAKLKADLKAQEVARAKAKADEAARQRANASDDPIGTLLQARNQPQTTAGGTVVQKPPAAAAPAPSAEPFVYFVQIGAFRDPEGAESQKARAAILGMNARVNERQQAGRTVYQVRLGPFNNKAEADSARSRLEGGGMETALVRVQR